MKKISSLFKIEFKRMFRTGDVLLFIMIFPLIMSLLMGAIYGNKLEFEGSSYTTYQYAFSSFICIAIFATGLMSIPINISDYRDKKILKKFKITPLSPLNILVAQVISAFITAIASSLLVFLVAKFAFGFYFKGSILLYLLTFLLVTVSIYSIGMLIASISKDSKSAGIITSILYFPALFVSGTTVPYDIMPKFLQKIADFLPMTQGVKLLSKICVGESLENVTFQIVVMSIVSIVCLILSLKLFKWN